jgi:hypothetical protein
MADSFLKQYMQDIAHFIYRDLNADLSDSGLLVVNFEIGDEVAVESPMLVGNYRRLIRENLPEQER